MTDALQVFGDEVHLGHIHVATLKPGLTGSVRDRAEQAFSIDEFDRESDLADAFERGVERGRAYLQPEIDQLVARCESLTRLLQAAGVLKAKRK